MRRNTTERAIAMTIAGSDSGGGAGIQADLKTFAALKLHGVSAITCVTAQNPREVRDVQAVRPRVVLEQIEAVFAELEPKAVKLGMLYSQKIIEKITEFFGIAKFKHIPLVIDPALVSTSGTRLLKPEAFRGFLKHLLPLATLTTPNLDEAIKISGRKIHDVEDMRSVARHIHQKFGRAVLLKGGHLKNSSQAIDVFYDGKEELMLEAPYVQGVKNHGTGCVYSAAITGYLALGQPLPAAVVNAKTFISRAIASSYKAGKHDVLNIA